MFVLQSVAGIDRSGVDGNIEFGGGWILVVEKDGAFKALEYAGSIIAGKSDRIAVRYLIILCGDKGEGASQEDQRGSSRGILISSYNLFYKIEAGDAGLYSYLIFYK